MQNKMSNELPKIEYNIREMAIRKPSAPLERINTVMQFNGTQNVDFEKWSDVAMQMNAKSVDITKNLTNGLVNDAIRIMQDDVPKRFALKTETWRVDVSEESKGQKGAKGKKGKKFIGNRRSSVNDNANYFVFVQTPDGALEYFEVNEWFNFRATKMKNVVSAEEAEKELNQREDALYKCAKSLKKKQNSVNDEDISMPGKKMLAKSFKLTADEFMDSENEANDGDADNDEVNIKKKNQVRNKSKQKLKNRYKKNEKEEDENSDDDMEAFEESDDGDGDGREVDYGSSSSDEEATEMDVDIKSIAEESAQNDMLLSDDEDSEREREKETEANEVMSDDDDNKDKFQKKNSGKITEAEVRRYLMRKPITPTDLLLKFKNKHSNMTSDELFVSLTEILKNLKPNQQTMQGKMYLSL